MALHYDGLQYREIYGAPKKTLRILKPNTGIFRHQIPVLGIRIRMFLGLLDPDPDPSLFP
jgi:hypothetical protein